MKLLIKYSSSLQFTYLIVKVVSIRRIVLLAEFPTIFALKIIFNCRNRYGTSEEKKESKMNLGSHFAPPKSAQIPTNYISKRCKLIQLFEFGGAFIIPSMLCRAIPVFLDPLLSRPVTLL